MMFPDGTSYAPWGTVLFETLRDGDLSGAADEEVAYDGPGANWAYLQGAGLDTDGAGNLTAGTVDMLQVEAGGQMLLIVEFVPPLEATAIQELINNAKTNTETAFLQFALGLFAGAGNLTVEAVSATQVDALVFFAPSGTGDGLNFMLDGEDGSGSATGVWAGIATDVTFTGQEGIIGTRGADTFTIATGFTNTVEAQRGFSDGRGDGRLFAWSGAGGADTFNGATGGELILIDYGAEAALQPGSVVAVVVNLTSVDQGLLDPGMALDTFGSIDTISNITAFRLTGAADQLFAGAAAVFVRGGGGNDDLSGGSAADEFFGEGDNDILRGGGGADHLDGGAGSDILDGGAGVDTLIGGLGDDLYRVDADNDEVVEPGGAPDLGGVDTLESAISRDLTQYAAIENLILVGAATTGTGNVLANTITGNASGNILNGGGGVDTLVGGLGDDTYLLGGDLDVVIELVGAPIQNGVDTMISTISRDLTSLDGVENLVLLGGAADGIGNTAANTITGNAAANKLSGGASSDVLIGDAGNDILDGGTGDDSLRGGAGDDTYFADSAGDSIAEAAADGFDVVNYSGAGTYVLAANVEKLNLVGSGARNATGNSLANAIAGNALANTLSGMSGADTMSGGRGNDTYIADRATDEVIEAAGTAAGIDLVRYGGATGTFVLDRGVENLRLDGNGATGGKGNSAANTITGNSKSNVLDGGLGKDTLAGGRGRDTFGFTTKLGTANIDVVKDFRVPDDSIGLENRVFTRIGNGDVLIDKQFHKSADGKAHDRDDRIVYETDTGKLFYDADGDGAGKAIQFAQMAKNLALTSADFLII